MKDFEVMPNGNIKVLGVSLGEYISKAGMILAEKGINPKKHIGHIEGKGNTASLNLGASFQFAKKCSVQFNSEWSGVRIVKAIIYGYRDKDINPIEIVGFIKKIATELNVELIQGYNKTYESESYVLKTELAEVSLNVPSKPQSIISIHVILIRTIQDYLSGEYCYTFINDLYMSYLDSLLVSPMKIKQHANANKIKQGFIVKSLLIVAVFIAIYIIASSCRYDTFKDKSKYMRYDTWTEKYEIYNTSSGKWEQYKR